MQAGSTSAEIRVAPVLIYLTGYFLFGAGYIAYMTFMIAYVRDAGGGALAQSAFWSCIGIGALAQPWVWGGMLGRNQNGRVTALLIGLTALGAAIPLLGASPIVLAASALIFGNSFFAVVSSTTAFVRLNYSREAWPKAIAMMTVAFGVGQTLGPIATGAITDRMGSLSFALSVSAVMLVLGLIASLCQRPLHRTAQLGGVAPPQPIAIGLFPSLQWGREGISITCQENHSSLKALADLTVTRPCYPRLASRPTGQGGFG